MNDLRTVAIIIVAAVAFVLYINLLCYIISVWSGWRKLASRFYREFNINERVPGLYSARMRFGCHYNNALKIGVNTEGLSLATIAIVPLHPPLFIPWNEIRVVRRSRVLWWTLIYLELGMQERIQFAIYEKTFAAINREGKLDATNIW